MNTWIKFLSDGSQEEGSDSDIDQKKASWTKGRQDIEKVSLQFNEKKVLLSADKEREWFQTDNFIYSSLNGTKRISREISCLTKGFKYVVLENTEDSIFTARLNNKKGLPLISDKITLQIGIEGQIIIFGVGK